MSIKYIIDLDNTLVFTDDLNNKAYKHSLKSHGFIHPDNSGRLTREIIFMNYSITNLELQNKIIYCKQKYFYKNIEETVLNDYLFKLVKEKNKSDCILWTSATPERADKILTFYNLHHFFESIVFCKKKDIPNDIKYLCDYLSTEKDNLLFFEDNKAIIEHLKAISCNVFVIRKENLSINETTEKG